MREAMQRGMGPGPAGGSWLERDGHPALRAQERFTPHAFRTGGVAAAISVVLAATAAAQGQDPPCTVTILNQTSAVDEEGNWFLFNVPANMGIVRARVTCTENGQTTIVMADPRDITADTFNLVEGLDSQTPARTPSFVRIVPDVVELGFAGATMQLRVEAHYPDGSVVAVTSGSDGVRYLTSSPAVATVGQSGRVTALTSGRVLVTAMYDSVIDTALVSVNVTGDADGDGMPDDYEVANGLDPANAADAFEDVDGDLLVNKDEFAHGSDLRNPDTDGEGLRDGEEVHGYACNETYRSDPLLVDTDGDRISDFAESVACTDPTIANGLEDALVSIELEPAETINLFLNSLWPGSSTRQLRVTGTLVGGGTVDLTTDVGTRYEVDSDVAVVSGGRLLPNLLQSSAAGTTSLAAAYGSLVSNDTEVTVTRVDPTPLSKLLLPGPIDGIALAGDYVLLAADLVGLHVVNVADPAAPVLVSTLGTPGRARHVAVDGDTAYVADGLGGVQVVDIAVPAAPVLLETITVPGFAEDLVLLEDSLVVSLLEDGIAVVDRTTHLVRGQLPLPGTSRGVDARVDLVAVAGDGAGLHVVRVPAGGPPALLGSVRVGVSQKRNATDVEVRGNLALVTTGQDLELGGLDLVSLESPATPVVLGRVGDRSSLRGLDLQGPIAATADWAAFNGLPFYRVTPPPPVVLGSVDFFVGGMGIESGQDVALRAGLAYLSVKRGLQIARVAVLQDPGGTPVVELEAPEPGASVLERRPLTLRARVEDDNYAYVAFLVDGVEAELAFEEPFEVSVDVGAVAGPHTVEAMAVDLAGHTARSGAVTFDVTPDDDPTVRVASPLSAVVEGFTEPITVIASDDVAVVEVRLFVNGTRVATLTEPPFVHLQYVSGTQLEIEAVAVDELGQVARDRVVVPVVPVPPSPPVLHLASPRNGDVFRTGSTVPVFAWAGSAVGVAKVAFSVDQVLLAEDMVAPYEIAFTSSLMPGPQTVEAVVTDGLQRTASASVTIQVSDTDPLTTVEGFVMGADGTPAVGAEVRVLPPVAGTFTGVAGAGGRFSIPGVPTLQGALAVIARVTVAGTLLEGASDAVFPLAGDVTDVGTVHLVPQAPAGGFPPLPAPEFPMEDQAHLFATADLDGDGRPDVVYAGGSFLEPSRVGVRLGDGQGGVGQVHASVSLETEAFQLDLRVADVDGDTRPDVVVACDGVRILLGNGDGTLGPPAVHLQGAFVTGVEVADVDGDGRNDLVAAHGGQPDGRGAITVMRGAGGGAFMAPERFDGLSTAGGYTGLAVGMLDADDHLDAVGFGPGDVEVYLSDGNPPHELSVTSFTTGQLYVRDAAIGQVTADGLADLVTIGPFPSGDMLGAFAGDGAGGFAAAVAFPTPGPQTDWVALADLDGDTRDDVVYFAEASQLRHVCVRRATGGLGMLGGELALRTPLLQNFIAPSLADVNGDGTPDLIWGPAGVNVAFADLAGSFHFPQFGAVPSTGEDAKSIAVAPLDAGTTPDVVVAGASGDALSVLLVQPGGVFDAERAVPQTSPELVRAGDVTGDGVPDLVVALPGQLDLRPGDGAGGFGATISSPAISGTAAQLELMSVDGDADLDVLFSVELPGVGWRLHAWINGGGTMGSIVDLGSGVGAFLAVGDIDGNGYRDVVTSTPAGTLTAYFGDAAGLHSIPLSSVGQPVEFVRLAELAGDEHLDLVTGLTPVCHGAACEEVSTDLVVYPWTGVGFGDPVVSTVPGQRIAPPLGAGGDWIKAMDVDDDGTDDLIALCAGGAGIGASSSFLWIPGTGAGRFGEAREFLGAGTGLAVGDLDADGRMDVVTLHPASGSVSWHRAR